ncbi:P-loop containing nucleoside triphosphate hydrolase protein [Coniochaeta sp. PMI_546]|nr:P-loop containing nucleoside triphosphate hydrolase protein [Coniochaeta sp. PMI_546]
MYRHGHLGHVPKGATRTRESRIRIHSQMLINAFRAVIDFYYPGQDFIRDTVEFRDPYRFLFHHRDKLKWYKDNHPPQHDQKYREVCNQHIDILLTELDKLMGKRYRQEEERIKRGVITFENLWMIFKPGEKMFAKAAEPEQTWPSLLVDIRGGIFKGKEKPYWVHVWFVFFNGVTFERMRDRGAIRPFEGEKEITSLMTYPQQFHKDTDEDRARYGGRTLAEQMAVWGERYWELRRPRLMEFHGECMNPKSLLRFTSEWDRPIRRDVDLSESSDSGSGSESERLRRRKKARRVTRLSPQEKARESITSQGCECEACSKLERDVTTGQNTTYRHYDGIEPSDDPPVDKQNFFSLCDRSVFAFALKERRWVRLDIEGLSVPTFDQNLFEYLVLPRQIKDTLEALALNNSDGKFSADFIRGKGEGQVFLLHGSPGVGKTCAAGKFCIAEMAERPLLSITSGDLGTKPDEFDANLRMYFRLGESWNAIVLIDEADIYFEARVETDIERNGLVSILLRALEYYRGTIFLTTNRIGVMDEAFTSRIHVSFGFPDLTDNDRERIWRNNFSRLTRDTDMEISETAKTYISTTEIRSLRWNGRHIRNAFQTAVALAMADKSHNGKRLTENHLQDVVRLYLEFNEYLDKVHKDMSPQEIAARKRIRAPVGS